MNNRAQPVKVIHMAPLSTGGISKLTVTIHKFMNPKRVQFDYLVFRNHKEFLEDEIIALGGKKQIVNTVGMKNKLLKCVKKIIMMRQLFQKEKYDVVHVDASTPFDVIVAISAKLAGVKTIIMHSHNDGFQKEIPLRDVFMGLYKKIMLFTVTDYFAISESAANFMFPKEIIKNKSYKTIRNGINVSEYLFSEKDREKARDELGVNEKFVVGHIGRFVYQKNHEFIIDVFEALYQKHPNTMLLLIGEGALMDDMKDRAKKKGLDNHICFYGVTHDIRRMLLAMDVFIFPSHFEGLGIAAIEAQATGLPICCADTIVEEVNITECFYRVHGWDKNQWAEELWKRIDSNGRRSYESEVVKAGYDVKAVANELEEFYLSRK